MNCPVCNKGLNKLRHAHIPYHLCSECLGIWVDAKLLTTLAARVAVEEDIQPEKRLDFKPRPVEGNPDPGRIRLCPSCSGLMKRFNYAYDSNIFLDRCPACDGLWLDGDEIRRIAKHIQFDPDVMLAEKGLLDLQNAPERAEEEVKRIMNTIYFVLEFLLSCL